MCWCHWVVVGVNCVFICVGCRVGCVSCMCLVFFSVVFVGFVFFCALHNTLVFGSPHILFMSRDN